MRGAVSQRRPAPSPSSSPSLASSPSLSSNPQPPHVDGQHGHISPSLDSQEHIRGQHGHIRTESTSAPSPSVPSSSVQYSNDDLNTAEEDSRFMICPYGDSFTDATYVVRNLNKIINNYWRGQWISYSNAPTELKDLWWNEFKRQFRWDEIEEEEVKRIFKKKAGDHIRNVMNKARTSQVKPHYITSDSWTEIKKTWEVEKNRQRSEQNKKNRASSFGEGSATYVGGSINIGEHRKRMADELGTEPTYATTFERAFQKKDKTWIGDRAKTIKEKYDELLASTASGGDGNNASEPAIDNMRLWVEASGGMRGGKIYGLGSLSRVYKRNVAATSSSNVAVSRRAERDEQVTQELTQLKHLLAKKDEEIRVVKQQYQSVQAQLQLVLQHLNLCQDQVPPVPHTNQIGDGHNDERHNDDETAATDDDFVSNS